MNLIKLLVSVVILGLFTLGLPLLAASDVQAGKAVYDSKCKICHAAEGEGNPAVAKTLKVEFQPLGSKEIQAQSDGEFKKQITEGGGKMPPVKGLSNKQIQDVIAFIRSLAKS
ncbi:MAG: cytochrome c [Acidobacteria bacterium]|nr:cytochrome c [Acidobacteriota bacterium]